MGVAVAVAGIPKQPVPVDAGRMVVYERSRVGALGYHNDLPRVASMIVRAIALRTGESARAASNS